MSAPEDPTRVVVAACSACGSGLHDGDHVYEEPVTHQLNFEDHTVTTRRAYVCERCHLTDVIRDALETDRSNRHAAAVRAVRAETGWPLTRCALLVREVRAEMEVPCRG